MVLSGPEGDGASPCRVSEPVSATSRLVGSRSAAASGWVSGVAVISDPLPVVVGALSGAVAAQRSFGASGIGTLEDPVLPGGQPSEHLGFACFGPGEPEVRFHAGEGVR